MTIFFFNSYTNIVFLAFVLLMFSCSVSMGTAASNADVASVGRELAEEVNL